jgi:hypothetical protein
MSLPVTPLLVGHAYPRPVEADAATCLRRGRCSVLNTEYRQSVSPPGWPAPSSRLARAALHPSRDRCPAPAADGLDQGWPEAIDAAGVLPHFAGIMVHDAFAPYAHYRSATHALCNAHMLRELIAVVDHHAAHLSPSSGDIPAGWCWAGQVIDALRALKAITYTGALPDPSTCSPNSPAKTSGSRRRPE